MCCSLPVSFFRRGPGSPTKAFALEWEQKLRTGWTSQKNILAQVFSSTSFRRSAFGDGGDFRVRARASQLSKAFWSDWREFKIPPKAPMAPAPPSPTR